MKLIDVFYAVTSPLTYAASILGRKKASAKTPDAETNLPTTKEGTVIPVLFGTRDVSAPVLGWYGNVRSDNEQDGDGLDYYVSALFILAHGQIERMTRISYGDKIVWSGDITDGFAYIPGNKNFEDNSCLSGKFHFDNGANSNAANSFLAGQTGYGVKYNGLAHVILEDNYIGKAPSLKAPKFRCYGKPASSYSFDPSGSFEKISTPEVLMDIQTFPFSSTPSGWDMQWAVRVTSTGKPLNLTEFAYSFYDTTRYDGEYQVGIIMSTSQETSGWQARFEADDCDYLTSFPDYNCVGTVEIPIDKFAFYSTADMCFVAICARVANHDPIFSTPIITAKIPSQVDANPAHILYAILTNKAWGLGYESSAINDGTFLNSANTLKNERLGLSLLWSESTSISEIVNAVLSHINGVLYLDRAYGRFNLSLIRKDYNEAELLVLDASNIIEVSNYTRGSFDELYNTLNLSFYNTQLGDSAGVTVSDLAATVEQGITRSVSVDFPAISNYPAARLVAARELKRVVSLQETATITANYDAQTLNLGDAFIVNYPKYWAAPVVMRVAKIDFGDGRTNQITIDAIKEWI